MSMGLLSYIRSTGQTVNDFAAGKLRRAGGQVRAWIYQGRTPSLLAALDVFVETDGYVDLSQWVDVGATRDGGKPTDSNPAGYWTEERVARLQALLLEPKTHVRSAVATKRGSKPSANPVYRVACPKCSAKVGRRCQTTGLRGLEAGQPTQVPHRSRTALAAGGEA